MIGHLMNVHCPYFHIASCTNLFNNQLPSSTLTLTLTWLSLELFSFYPPLYPIIASSDSPTITLTSIMFRVRNSIDFVLATSLTKLYNYNSRFVHQCIYMCIFSSKIKNDKKTVYFHTL